MLNKYKNNINKYYAILISVAFIMNLCINKADAYTINDKNTFDEYKQKIELLSTELERDYKISHKLSS